MPGGYLSFGIYQKLGGERDFGDFWLKLGLPSILLIAAGYFFLVAQRVVTQKQWMIGSVAFIVGMALAVFVRMLH